MNLVLFEPNECAGGTNGGEILVRLSRRDARAVHLQKTLHKTTGSGFDAGILGGNLGTGLIKELDGEHLLISLDLPHPAPPRTPLRLVVGFPRPIQLRRLLRDIASLGLTAVDLAGTDLGEKSYRDTNLLRNGGAHAALIEGAAQARDTRLPGLAVYPSLDAWLTDHSRKMAEPDKRQDLPLLIAADNVEPQGSFSCLPPSARPLHGGTKSGAVLAVGPERGWSGRERELLEHAGFLRLSMGSRALRTETACTAAAAILMEKMGLLHF
jgi:16S rRNA U1498 N3-methylase RsmE